MFEDLRRFCVDELALDLRALQWAASAGEGEEKLNLSVLHCSYCLSISRAI
jgi:hypothetical protein